MGPTPSISITIQDEPDVVIARTEAKYLAREIGFDQVDQSRIATVASELAVNVLRHAHQGVMRASLLQQNGLFGLEIVFQDQGPGIPDVESAVNGTSPPNGKNSLGLSATKILVDEFEIESQVGQGTTVVIRKWMRC
ncbi:MAG: anti-sigma regulatory factor [Armatimonadetes bacterium]|nr:anti-sigma regulatory factor [Armatimonadota bacterium]